MTFISEVKGGFLVGWQMKHLIVSDLAGEMILNCSWKLADLGTDFSFKVHW